MAGKEERREASPGVSTDNPWEEDLKGQYTIVREIGKGAFGSIHLARHILTGTEVAIKVIDKSRHGLPFMMEVEIMKTVEHQHVVQLFEIVETPNSLFIIMEFVSGGQLPIGLREEEARRLFRQILWAVRYCHQEGIVHRDLKPSNILLDQEGNVKLIDFGLSRKIKSGQQLTAFCGTLAFCAPEMYEQQPYGPEVDIWGLGILLHFILTETLPFQSTSFKEMRERVVRGQYKEPTHLSPEAQDIIRQLLTVDPAQRPTADEILGHPWLVQGEDIPPPPKPLPKEPNALVLRVMRCLGYDPHLTWMSVSDRRFDHLCATYLIVQWRMSQGAVQVRQKHQGSVLPPTPAHPSALPPVLRASEPARPTSPLLSGNSLDEEDSQSGQKWDRGHSLPHIPLGSVGGSSAILMESANNLPSESQLSPKGRGEILRTESLLNVHLLSRKKSHKLFRIRHRHLKEVKDSWAPSLQTIAEREEDVPVPEVHTPEQSDQSLPSPSLPTFAERKEDVPVPEVRTPEQSDQSLHSPSLPNIAEREEDMPVPEVRTPEQSDQSLPSPSLPNIAEREEDMPVPEVHTPEQSEQSLHSPSLPNIAEREEDMPVPEVHTPEQSEQSLHSPSLLTIAEREEDVPVPEVHTPEQSDQSLPSPSLPTFAEREEDVPVPEVRTPEQSDQSLQSPSLLTIAEREEDVPVPEVRTPEQSEQSLQSPSLPTIAEGEENVPVPEVRTPEKSDQSQCSPSEKTPAPSVAPPHNLEAAAPDVTRGWRQAGKRFLGSIMRACCCCLMAKKIRPGSSQEAEVA